MQRIDTYVLILTTVLLLGLALPVSALEDFSVTTTTENITFCSCSLHEQSFTITNTGTVASLYFIQPTGKYARWQNFAPSSFILDVDQSAVITQYINPRCDAVGEFSADFVVQTETGVSHTVRIPASISNCYAFSFIPKPAQTYVCGFTYEETFILQNDGLYPQHFQLAASTEVISPKQISLTAEQRESVTVSIPTSCTQLGEKSLTVQATSQASKQSLQQQFSYAVLSPEEAYAYTIDPLVISSTYKDRSVSLTLRNTGIVESMYHVMLQQADFATLAPAEFTLQPGEQHQLPLQLHPQETDEAGNYTAVLQVKQDDNITYHGLAISLSPSLFQRLSDVYHTFVKPYLLYLLYFIVFLILLVLLYLFVISLRYRKQSTLKQKMNSYAVDDKAKIDMYSVSPTAVKSWEHMKADKTYVMGVPYRFSVKRFVISLQQSAVAVSLKMKPKKKVPKAKEKAIPSKRYEIFSVQKTNLLDSSIRSITVQFRVEDHWLREQKVKKRNISLFRLRRNVQEFPATYLGYDGDLYHYYEAVFDGFSTFVIGERSEQRPVEPSTEDFALLDNILQRKAKKEQKQKQKKHSHVRLHLAYWIIILLLLASPYVEQYPHKPIFEPPAVENTTIAPQQLTVEQAKQVEIAELKRYIVDHKLHDSFRFLQLKQNTNYAINLSQEIERENTQLHFGVSGGSNVTAFLDGSVLHVVPKPDWYGIDQLYVLATDEQDYLQVFDVTVLVEEFTGAFHERTKDAFETFDEWLSDYMHYVVSVVFIALLVYYFGRQYYYIRKEVVLEKRIKRRKK